MDADSGTASGTSIKVYIPHERPIRTFRGDDDDVENFIRETKHVIKSRGLKQPEDVDLVISYLEGEARREINLRKKYGDLAAVYGALREAFGDCRTASQLLRAFYDRTQRSGESLRHFSHSIDSLAWRIEDRKPGAFPDCEKSKRDQFVEGLIDVPLRQHLKHLIRNSGANELTFLEVRKEACLWTDEHDGATSCQTMATSKPEDTKMMTLVQSLTEQLTQLSATVSKLVAEKESNTYAARQWGPPQSQPPLICYACHQPGHIARRCPQNAPMRNYSGNDHPQS